MGVRKAQHLAYLSHHPYAINLRSGWCSFPAGLMRLSTKNKRTNIEENDGECQAQFQHWCLNKLALRKEGIRTPFNLNQLEVIWTCGD